MKVRFPFIVAAIVAVAIVSLINPLMEHAQGPSSNTPPIVIPSNLGIWGTTVQLTTATADVIAAPALSSTRNYVDQVQCFDSNATATTVKIFKDGDPATTVLAYANCPASFAQGGLITFYPPLQLNGGAAVTVAAVTAATNLYINVHSYQSR